MRTAKKLQTSHLTAERATPFGPVREGLVKDRSKSATGEPKGDNYGDAALTVLVGVDGEWVNYGSWNKVLSYQFYCTSIPGGDWKGLIQPSKGRRLRLAKFLTQIITVGIAQGHLTNWPARIYLVAHFALADLVVFADFPHHQNRVDSVRKTFVTIGRPLRLRLWDKNRHLHKVEVVVRDTMLLAPAKKQALSDLGELVHLKKLEIPHEEKVRMDMLLQNNPDRFFEYALRDPEICVRYALRMMELNRELLGEFSLPSTLSSIGVSLLLQHWEQAGISKHTVLGTEIVTEISWSSQSRRRIARHKEVPTADRHAYESLATECYHGGRNEQYFFGAGEPGVWTDWDLVGAYTTAMAEIGTPQWNTIRQTRDLDEFQPNVLGYARVRFEFPANTRFPCLPVRTAHGLIFPLSGDTYCCAPEIFLARRLGARLEIVTGIILPTSFEIRPFEQFIVDCSSRRKSFPQGSLEELFWKELGNGTYGKVAQGLRRKRAFNSRTDTHVDLPPSRITNPFFAAYVTSLVRAVLGEIVAALPLHSTVCNVTTDGFLTNATEEEVIGAATGIVCQQFAQSRLRISGDDKFLEVKHRIAQPLGWRTRGQATLQSLPGEKSVLAKAGLKPPVEVAALGQAAQNEYIIDLFLNRSRESREEFRRLRGLIDIYRKGGDLVDFKVSRTVSMEFDWKRCPVGATARAIHGVNHLYFDTAPWLGKDDFDSCREAFDAFRGTHAGILKTEGDLRDFLEFFALHGVVEPGVRIPRRDPALTLARRSFLRAYVRSEWGLDRSAMTYSGLAVWLTSIGVPTKKSDVENANRSSAALRKHVVLPTPAVSEFVTKIHQTFPNFESAKLLCVPNNRHPLV